MKRSQVMKSTLAAFIAASAVVAMAQTPERPPVTLKTGDTAPPLVVGKWLKGELTPKFGDGKVYVLEFWATWCGPCKQAMPHLSDMAKKYKGKAEFIGVNVWESRGANRDYNADVTKADKFADQAGDMMAYHVAMDTKEDDMAKTWMAAAGQNGIPASFVVDGTGKILWIGHPVVGLEEAVQAAIAGTLTVESGKKISTDIRAKFNSFYPLMTKHSDAMKAGNYAEALKVADEVLALVPDISEPYTMRAQALMQSDPAAGRAYIEDKSKKFGNAPLTLTAFAKAITDSEKSGKQDLSLALNLLNKAAKYTGQEDFQIMPAMAAVHFKLGDKEAAVKTQARYVELISDPALKAPANFVDAAKKKLAEYQGTAN